DIEQELVLVDLEILVVPAARRALLLVAVAPVERALGEGATGQRGPDVGAVARKSPALPPAARADESRQPVHRDDRCVAAAARPNHARPAHDRRDAQATLEQLGLLAGE